MAAATGFYFGYFPFISGTAGSLVALPLIWATASLPVVGQILLAGAMVWGGVKICDRVRSQFKKKDAPQIVVDEVVGFYIAMIAIPFTPFWVISGFILFRFFDIFKPFPISWVDENVKGGQGIMFDDVLAGLCSNLILHLMIRATL